MRNPSLGPTGFSSAIEEMGIRSIPGLSIRLFQEGDILFKADLGITSIESQQTLSPKAQFRIGCCTKLLTALAILMLEEKGFLDIDDPISTYLPTLSKTTYPPNLAQVKIRHLLNHTSGLARGDYHTTFPNPVKTLQKIAQTHLVFIPGKKYKYSNWAYFLLGCIIESASNKSTVAFVEENILKPLKMHDSLFQKTINMSPENLVTGYWNGWHYGSPDISTPPSVAPWYPLHDSVGGLITTTSDYSNFLQALVGNPIEGSTNIFSSAIRRKICTPQHIISHKHRVSSTFGAFINHRPKHHYIYLTGSNSGYTAQFFAYPTLGITGVLFANRLNVNFALRSIFAKIVKKHCPMLNSQAIYPTVKERKLLLTNKNGNTIRVNFSQNKDHFMVMDEKSIKLHPDSNTNFFILDGNFRHMMLRLSTSHSNSLHIDIGPWRFHQSMAIAEESHQHDMLMYNEGTDYGGFYYWESFGKVEVFKKAQNWYISWGVAYESKLHPKSIHLFQFKNGPFIYEHIEFRTNERGAIDHFVCNNMLFSKHEAPINAI